MFITENYAMTVVEDRDIPKIARIYNGNPKFLRSHLGLDTVDEDWVRRELESSLRIGLCCCKIEHVPSGNIVGFMDFEMREQAYLSLLMLAREAKGHGVGSEIMDGFENYARSRNARSLRIDVVTGYDDLVLRFWERRGFAAQQTFTLSWNDQDLPAVKMTKPL